MAPPKGVPRPGYKRPPGLTTALRPRRFEINEKCSGHCSVSRHRLPGEMADLVHDWFQAGHSNMKIIALAAEHNVKLSNSSLGRHRKNHLDLLPDAAPEIDPETLRLAKVNHVELLEQIVARSAQSIHRSRITPELGLKAMDMVYKLTQGSAMESFMEAVTSAMAAADDDEGEYKTAIEAADAEMAADEQAQGDVIT